jgi:DNA-binding transcriptional MerR regulator
MRSTSDDSKEQGTHLPSIGELAQMTGVNSRTIRYYEELGILPEPLRSPAGTRKYPKEYRFYIEGALSLKQAGFSLDEVRLVGRLAVAARLTPAERAKALRIISEKRQHLEHKIRLLNRIHELLERQEERDRTGHGHESGQVPSERFAAMLRA